MSVSQPHLLPKNLSKTLQKLEKLQQVPSGSIAGVLPGAHSEKPLGVTWGIRSEVLSGSPPNYHSRKTSGLYFEIFQFFENFLKSTYLLGVFFPKNPLEVFWYYAKKFF